MVAYNACRLDNVNAIELLIFLTLYMAISVKMSIVNVKPVNIENRFRLPRIQSWGGIG